MALTITSAASAPSMEFLETVTLRQILNDRRRFHRQLVEGGTVPRKVVFVTSRATVQEALSKMKENNVTALLIVDLNEQQRPLGIVNIFDILVPVVFQPCFDQDKERKTAPDKLAELFRATLKKAVFSVPVVELLGISSESKRLWSFEDDVSFSSLANVMAQGVHRALVVPSISSLVKQAHADKPSPKMDQVVSLKEFVTEPTEVPKEGTPVRPASDPSAPVAMPTVVTKQLGILEPADSPRDGQLLTQSDVVAFLSLHRTRLASFFTSRLSDLNLGTTDASKLLTMKPSEPALVGYRRLLQESPSAVPGGLGEMAAIPVVGENGILLANLSASDLRSITVDNLSTLLLPVLEYLAVSSGGIRPIVAVKTNELLGDVVSKILHSRVHRAYIVDDGMHIKGVVSLTDLIARCAGLGLKRT